MFIVTGPVGSVIQVGDNEMTTFRPFIILTSKPTFLPAQCKLYHRRNEVELVEAENSQVALDTIVATRSLNLLTDTFGAIMGVKNARKH